VSSSNGLLGRRGLEGADRRLGGAGRRKASSLGLEGLAALLPALLWS